MRNSVELTEARKFLIAHHLPGLESTQLWNESGDCHGRCKERVLQSVPQDAKFEVFIYLFIGFSYSPRSNPKGSVVSCAQSNSVILLECSHYQQQIIHLQ